MTGSSGLVGSSLRRRLASDEEFQVVPVGRDEPLPTNNSPAIVVHAAWPSSDAAAWGPFRDWSQRLRASAADCGAWFVGIGSGVEVHEDNVGLKEPYRSYAHRKLELRSALEEQGQEKLAWLRLHFMFGPGEQPSRLVPAAVRAGLADEVFVCGSLDRRRRWLHVDDQAAYLAQFLNAPQPGEWDIAGRSDVSFRDLLALVGRALGRKLQLKESDAPAPDSAVPVIVPERIASVVPADAGDLDSLLGRLKEYVAQLIGASTASESRLG